MYLRRIVIAMQYTWIRSSLIARAFRSYGHDKEPLLGYDGADAISPWKNSDSIGFVNCARTNVSNLLSGKWIAIRSRSSSLYWQILSFIGSTTPPLPPALQESFVSYDCDCWFQHFPCHSKTVLMQVPIGVKSSYGFGSHQLKFHFQIWLSVIQLLQRWLDDNIPMMWIRKIGSEFHKKICPTWTTLVGILKTDR